MKRVLASTLLLILLTTSILAQSDYLKPYNEWSAVQQITELADLDGDGDLDAFATNIHNLSFSTFFYNNTNIINQVDYIPNTGNSTTPKFETYDNDNAAFQFLIENFVSDGSNNSIFNGILRFEDMDNDNDLDLFMATTEELGRVLYFKNIGNSTSPNYQRDNTYDATFPKKIADFQLIDLDNDGNKDLIANAYIFDYDCSNFPFGGCTVIELEHELLISKNDNGFNDFIAIENLYPSFSCNCTFTEAKIQSFAIRDINNQLYLTYQIDLLVNDFNEDQEFIFIKMYNAELNIDWVTEFATIDTSSSIVLPYRSNNKLVVADINNDDNKDILNGSLQLLSTNNPNTFLHTAFNPYEISPYVTSLPSPLDTIQYQEGQFVEGENAALVNYASGLSANMEVLDFNSNGTKDLIRVESFGLTIIEDFENNINQESQLLPFPNSEVQISLFNKNDFKLRETNGDGYLDVFNYYLDYDENFNQILGVSLRETHILNDSVYYGDASIIYEETLNGNIIDIDDKKIFASDFSGDNLDDLAIMTFSDEIPSIHILILYNHGSELVPNYSGQINNPVSKIDLNGLENFNLSYECTLFDFDADGDFDILSNIAISKTINKLLVFENTGSIVEPEFDSWDNLLDVIFSSPVFVFNSPIDFQNNGSQDLLVSYQLLSVPILTNYGFIIAPLEEKKLFDHIWEENVLYINQSTSPFSLNNEGVESNLDTTIINLTHLQLVNVLDIANVINESVFYTVDIPTDNGILVNLNTNEIGIKAFTQADLDNGFIVYISSNSMDDDFTFTINYGAFKLVNQTFIIEKGIVSGIGNNASVKISIYPNPSSDWISVEQTGIFNYNIININGKIVASKKGSNSNKIDINELSKGTYVLELYNQQDFKYGSFVKQ